MPTSPIAPNTFAVRVPNPQKMTPCEEVVLGVFEFRKFLSEWYSWMFTAKLDANGNPIAVFSDDFKQMLCDAQAGCVTTTSTTTVTTTGSTSTTSSTTTTTAQSINVTINDNAPATPYPSTRFYSPTGQTISDINIQLIGLTHGSPADVSMLLVGPTGVAVMLMSKCGGYHPILNINLTFDQAASASLPTANDTQMVAGTFKPTIAFAIGAMPPPAPAPPGTFYNSNLNAFNGTDPHGVWSLYIIDDVPVDVGSLQNWNLVITP